MIPQQLSDWSIESITEVLITGRFETETFDFKEKLPDARDEKAKERLRKTCCAFANSDGGFIVFGIIDDKSKPPEKRLVGLSPNYEFPEHIGNYPRSCVPSIYWTFLNPPLTLPDSNVLHIVHIPKSWKAPHATGSFDKGWDFTKRTNKGNEGMGIEEIRSGFLGYYEKRLKLQLLRSELILILENTKSGYVTVEEAMNETYSLITFDTSVMESVISDTYSITANQTELLKLLSEIRQETRVANNKIKVFFGVVHLPLTKKDSLAVKHNKFMKEKCGRIKLLCEKAIAELDKVLSM